MRKTRVVIADDEPLARRGIRQLLLSHVDIEIVAEARNGLDTVRKLRALKPDLLFLDVQMPDIDGFEVVERVGPGFMPALIFVTAYDEFAVRAFEAHALDYLVKPLEVARFSLTLERVRDHFNSLEAIDQSRKLAALLATHNAEVAKERIVVSTANGKIIVDANDVDWIEADDYYAAIHARTGRHLIRESLSSLEQRLDRKRFLRTHRSAIVNVDRISELRKEKGETLVILKNGALIPVSRRRRRQITRLLKSIDR